MPTLPTLREMLDNGVHFGHTTSKWNPKMKPYIYSAHDKIHIINLEQTKEKLEEALKFLQGTVERGGTVLFVGTKKQASELVKGAAERCGMPYVATRWFGGELTNFSVLKSNLKTLDEIEQSEKDGRFDHLTKKERLGIEERKNKLLTVLSGVRTLNRLPNALFIVDAGHEDIAVNEAHCLHIPIVALIDTNSNPDTVDYPIPANDDSPKSLSLILNIVCETIKEARVKSVTKINPDEKPSEVPAAESKEEKKVVEQV